MNIFKKILFGSRLKKTISGGIATILMLTLGVLYAPAAAPNFSFNVSGVQFSSGNNVPATCNGAALFYKNTSPLGWNQCLNGTYSALATTSSTSIPNTWSSLQTFAAGLGTQSINGGIFLVGGSGGYTTIALANTACSANGGGFIIVTPGTGYTIASTLTLGNITPTKQPCPMWLTAPVKIACTMVDGSNCIQQTEASVVTAFTSGSLASSGGAPSARIECAGCTVTCMIANYPQDGSQGDFSVDNIWLVANSTPTVYRGIVCLRGAQSGSHYDNNDINSTALNSNGFMVDNPIGNGANVPITGLVRAADGTTTLTFAASTTNNPGPQIGAGQGFTVAGTWGAGTCGNGGGTSPNGAINGITANVRPASATTIKYQSGIVGSAETCTLGAGDVATASTVFAGTSVVNFSNNIINMNGAVGSRAFNISENCLNGGIFPNGLCTANTGIVKDLWFYGNNPENSGVGLAEFYVDGYGGNGASGNNFPQSIHVFGMHNEPKSTDATAVGTLIRDAMGVDITGLTGSGAANPNTGDLVRVEQSATGMIKGIRLRYIQNVQSATGGGFLNTVNDAVLNKPYPQVAYPTIDIDLNGDNTDSRSTEFVTNGLIYAPDMTAPQLVDEFIGGGSGASGVNGETGFISAVVNAGTCAGASQNGAPPEFGIFQFTANTATAGTGCALHYGAGPFGNMSLFFYDAGFKFKIESTASIRARVGFFQSGQDTVALPPSNWWGIRADTNLGDTNFMYTISVAGSEATTLSTGIALDTNFHTIRIRQVQISPVKILLSFDNAVEKSICAAGCDITATPGTGNMTAAFQVVTDTTATKAADAARFWWSSWNTGRVK